MTDEEKDKKRKEFYYSDGRINPDKAFTYILEAMDSLSPEEFRRLATTPVQIVGKSGPTRKEAVSENGR